MSPAARNVLSVVAGIAAIIGLFVLFGQRPDAPGPAASPATTTPATTSAAPASEAAASDGGGAERGGRDVGASPATDADAQASAQRASDGAAVWVNHDLATADWQAQLQPQVDPTAWPQLALPDPQRVTPRTITGQPKPVTVTATAATYNVPTDAGDLAVTVIRKEDGTWVVSNIAKDL